MGKPKDSWLLAGLALPSCAWPALKTGNRNVRGQKAPVNSHHRERAEDKLK